MEVPSINDGTRCTEIDAEALENLRIFFAIVAAWEEEDLQDPSRRSVSLGLIAEHVGEGLESH